jgi:hypothetical protein
LDDCHCIDNFMVAGIGQFLHDGRVHPSPFSYCDNHRYYPYHSGAFNFEMRPIMKKGMSLAISAASMNRLTYMYIV